MCPFDDATISQPFSQNPLRLSWALKYLDESLSAYFAS